MKVAHSKKEFFKDCELITSKKVLLDVCDLYYYGITDSNLFYQNYYTGMDKSFKQINPRKFGSIGFTDIFSYHQICHMICVDLPKTQYNIVPFHYDAFNICCKHLKEYCDKNEVNTLITPVFGKETIEGDWKEILNILKDNFPTHKLIIYK